MANWRQQTSAEFSSSETPIEDKLVDGVRAESHGVRSVVFVSNVQVADSSAPQLEILLEHGEYARENGLDLE